MRIRGEVSRFDLISVLDIFRSSVRGTEDAGHDDERETKGKPGNEVFDERGFLLIHAVSIDRKVRVCESISGS